MGQKKKPYFNTQVSLSSFSFLISSCVQYSQERIRDAAQLQVRIHKMGYHVGARILDACALKTKHPQREIRIEHMLSFIKTQVWKNLFSRNIDAIHKAETPANSYLIYDRDPVEERFIFVPEKTGFRVSSFTAGLLEGMLNQANFDCTVSVTKTTNDGIDFIVYIITLKDHVVEREKILNFANAQ